MIDFIKIHPPFSEKCAKVEGVSEYDNFVSYEA